MQNAASTVVEKGAIMFVLALCLSVTPAKAGAVFMWAANGTDLLGLNSSGQVVESNALPGAFSVATFNNTVTGLENIFVSVPGSSGQLYMYTFNEANNTLSGPSQPFTFTPDGSAGGISPQEITVDQSGSLWTTSFDGAIQKYQSGCTQPCAGTTEETIPGARGIFIGPQLVYVTVEPPYGSEGGVDEFDLASPGTVTTPYTLGSLTAGTGGPETGQLRGITMDEANNIYYADSTWGAPGTDDGYICVSARTICDYSATTRPYYTTGLNGPNELISGQGSDASGTGASFDAGCDVLYAAEYYGSVITEINIDEQLNGNSFQCGTPKATEPFASNSTVGGSFNLNDVSGIALDVGDAGIVGSNTLPGVEGPASLFSDAAPEPGTWVLMVSALLGIVAMRFCGFSFSGRRIAGSTSPFVSGSKERG